MAVTYTKSMQKLAKEKGRHLVTIAARGVEFQGPVDQLTSLEIVAFLNKLLERRSAELKAEREAK